MLTSALALLPQSWWLMCLLQTKERFCQQHPAGGCAGVQLHELIQLLDPPTLILLLVVRRSHACA